MAGAGAFASDTLECKIHPIPFILIPPYSRKRVKEHRVAPKNSAQTTPVMHASFSHLQANMSPSESCLAGPGLDLGGGALGALLGLDLGGLATGTGGGALSLLGLLGRLGGSLLLLALLDGGLAGGGAGLGALGAALLDHVERGTDDGTLLLDGAAGALLGNLLEGGQ